MKNRGNLIAGSFFIGLFLWQMILLYGRRNLLYLTVGIFSLIIGITLLVIWGKKIKS